jgi:hypothetical protein
VEQSFKFDISTTDRLEMKRQNIDVSEIESIFKSKHSYHEPFDGFEYFIGFSNKRKFIHFAFCVHKELAFDYQILQIDLPYEHDIRKYYCQRT